jgi:hypothetical protein
MVRTRGFFFQCCQVGELVGAGSLWQDGSGFNCTHEIQLTCYTLCKLKEHPWLWNLEDFELLGKKKEGDSVGPTMKVKRIALIKW